MPEIVLTGCRSVPLAHYLKALGVLRIVAEQADGTARGAWRSEAFVLDTQLDVAGLSRFFLEDYQPAAIVAPWNGGSGFGAKDNREAIDAIGAGESPRLLDMREAIEAARAARERLGITDKTEDAEAKEALIRLCRATLPDAALAWLDAAVVLTNEKAAYPPLLGTGGNDGRLDFTNNFMQRIVDVFDPHDGSPRVEAAAWLDGALFGTTIDNLQGGRAIGQFLPGAAGGANAGPSFMADSLINPWDFILMLEGALVFAGAATRRLGPTARGAMAFPFTVRSVGAGYGSAARDDEREARAETWLPLWERPAGAREVQALFAEGRVQVRKRMAATGLDFVRAAATLGVDRGITAFERYGFLVRNGMAYFATPLGRFVTSRNPDVELLDDATLDGWLTRFRQAASAKEAPASVGRAMRRLEDAIFVWCQAPRTGGGRDPGPVEAVLVALGGCERALARSSKWADDARLPPMPPLSPRWLAAADDQSCEFRLAMTLASSHSPGRWTLRSSMEPLEARGQRLAWGVADDPDVVWPEGTLTDRMIALLHRRLLASDQGEEKGAESPSESRGGFPVRSRLWARKEHLVAFLDGRTDDARLLGLIEALALVDWEAFKGGQPPWQSPPDAEARKTAERELVPILYALVKLCHMPRALGRPGAEAGVVVRAVPEIARRLAAGTPSDVKRACELAVRRLRGSGLPPLIHEAPVGAQLSRRIAAALLFDVPPTWLLNAAIRPADQVLIEGTAP